MRAIASTCFILLVLFYTACTTKTEVFQSESLSDFIQLQPGKFIIYRLDSTVYTENGRNEEIHSYQEKDIVDAEIVDGSGRKSYRIFRFIRNLSGSGPWQPVSTYFITPGNSTLELVEDNLRIVQLSTPFTEGTTWKGNQYLGLEPYRSAYDFLNDNYIKDWNFKVVKTGETLVINGKSIPEVSTIIRVNERDVPDTVQVNNNAVSIRANDTSVWIRGNATANIMMNVANPTERNFRMSVYNNSNFPAVLNSIPTPPMMSRSFEFVDGAWTFGARDSVGKRVDRATPDLPRAERSYAADKFAKNIGLVEQELTLWEFQPNQNGSGTSYKVGFGVKRTMLEHN
jgi:hypothetical protein